MMISEILLAGSVVCRLVMQVQMNRCGANASITGCVGATWVCGDIYHNFLLGSVWERYLRICNFLLGLIGSTCNATGTEAKKAPRKLLLKYNWSLLLLNQSHTYSGDKHVVPTEERRSICSNWIKLQWSQRRTGSIYATGFAKTSVIDFYSAPTLHRLHFLSPFTFSGCIEYIKHQDGLNTMAHSVCANCGRGGIELVMCNSCKHIKYCSVTCQKQHWPKHKQECKQCAARSNKFLFKQPPPKDDCPICFLPMPFEHGYMASLYPCCGKIVCDGCHYSNHTSRNHKCPFCSENVKSNNLIEQVQKWVEANDDNALTMLGFFYFNGAHGLQKEWNKAFELWTRAVELGSSRAWNEICGTYLLGKGVM